MDALVKAGIIDVEIVEEGRHCEVLVVGTLKVGQETATREATCDLGALGSPYGRQSYPRTCEGTTVQ